MIEEAEAQSPPAGFRVAKAVKRRCKRRNLGSDPSAVNPKLQKSTRLRESSPAAAEPERAGRGAGSGETGAGNGIRTRDPQLGRLTLYH